MDSNNNNNNNNYNAIKKDFSTDNYRQRVDDLNNIIGNVHQNINDLDQRINNQKDYKKNSYFNENKINFHMLKHSNSSNLESNIPQMNVDEVVNINIQNQDVKNQPYVNKNNTDNNEFIDLSIINEINDKHPAIKKILYGRKNMLKRIAKFCAEKDVASALNYLSMINETCIYNDFLNFSLLQTDTIRVPLVMDNALFLLTHVIDLINSKYDNYRRVGLHSSLVLLKLFSERIITTKGSVTNGIDLNKEERLKKCDKIIDIYKSIRDLSIIEQLNNQKENDDVS
jgi:hypothetical protein